MPRVRAWADTSNLLPKHDRSPVGFGVGSRTAVSAYGASMTSQALLSLLSRRPSHG